jgi:4-alpha-glucanotransferase
MELPRSAGILLHPSSLPGGHGIGDLGHTARTFVDRLDRAGQKWWQVLPLNPPDFLGSPYSSSSSMACDPRLIDLEELVSRGWLEPTELASMPHPEDPSRIELDVVEAAKEKALRTAFERAPGDDADFAQFCVDESAWLDDYALFSALQAAHGPEWKKWPEPFVRREAAVLRKARVEHRREIEFVQFKQWIFDRQWSALREYAAERGVKIIGDVPIFVAMNSADVWANRDIFEVDEHGEAKVVAGVPPDYFSPTGQRWGNPLFRWDVLAERNYDWWGDRIARVVELVDIARIDHFRGFEGYYAIPAESPTAEVGEWRKGPGDAFFDWVKERFHDVPFIAEDLGVITPEVAGLRDRHGLPGMKILQFGFDGDVDHPFLPDNYPENCVAYTGTHDNDTTMGWWRSTSEETRHTARVYLSHPDEGIVWAMIEALMQSDAALVVIPVQDLYELGNEARMNLPGTSDGNWTWRMTEEQLDDLEPWDRLGQLVDLYGR